MSVTQLDIYQKAKDLLQHTVICVKDFDKASRDTLGKSMVDFAMNALLRICEANALNYSGKVEKLIKTQELIETLDGYFNAAFDMRILQGIDKQAKAMHFCNDLLVDIKRWKRYNENALTKGRGNTQRQGVVNT